MAEGGSGESTGEAEPDALAVEVLERPVFKTPFTSSHRCINDRAVWNLSGARPGNGVDELLDDDLSTFWQSDGSQPHLITLRFYERETVLGIALYVDYASDESYCPQKLSIRAGHILHNLRVVRDVELDRPTGWVWIPLSDPDLEGVRPLRVHLVQVAITQMHQSGRDTHVRQVRVIGTTSPPTSITDETTSLLQKEMTAFRDPR